VEAANHRLARVEQIRRYHVLPDEWPADGDLVTPTLKLRRQAVLRRYRDIIEDLYRPERSASRLPLAQPGGTHDDQVNWQ
jgi:long-chain acyl-CoA synthetase